MSHAGDVTCACVTAHSPVPVDVEVHHIHPLFMGGPDTEENREPVCGNTHNNVHVLLRAYQKAGGTPAWEVRRRFSPFTRDLAQRGWDAHVAAQGAAA